MSKIRSKDTKPELALRKALFARGFRYRVNVPNLPGKPDILKSATNFLKEKQSVENKLPATLCSLKDFT